MEPARALYELQSLDLAISADTAKVQSERAKIREPQQVRDARRRVEEARKDSAGIEKGIRSAEMDAAAISSKKKAVHDKLYGGKVTTPRELSALESEEEQLARNLDEVESRTLELMAAGEAAEEALAAAERQLKQALGLWSREGHEAQDHIPQLEREMQELAARRDALAGQVAPANLNLYERLKPRKGNRPVSLVENNSCQGCGVSLPSGEVHRARGADPPLLCDNCGRILYVR